MFGPDRAGMHRGADLGRGRAGTVVDRPYVSSGMATATNMATGASVSTTTDSYGDFWLKELVPGEYTLVVEKAGFLREKMGPIDARKDINVGDISVWKA